MNLSILTFGAIAVAVIGLLAGPAYASGECNGAGNCNDSHDTNQSTVVAPVTTNTNTAGAAAAASAEGGDAVNFNANVAKGGNVEKSGNSANFNAQDVDVRNSNRSSNKNTNLQGQKQKQQQQQGQFQGQSIDDSGNASINWQNQRETASAYSPALVAASETCVQSQSAGAQGPAFGISLGFSHTNEGCEMRRNAGMLFALGNKAAAVELLCTDDDVRAALLAANTPCKADQQVAPQAQLDGAEGARQAALAPMAPIADSE